MPVVGWPRTLNWGNFRVVKFPADGSIYDAETGTSIGYKSQYVKQNDGSFATRGVVIRVELVKENTWVVSGKQSPGLLSHEQGHFDIAGLIAYELDMSLRQASGMSNDEVNSNVEDMFRVINEKVKKIQSEYDDDTNHSINNSQQVAWKRKIKDHINKQYEPL